MTRKRKKQPQAPRLPNARACELIAAAVEPKTAAELAHAAGIPQTQGPVYAGRLVSAGWLQDEVGEDGRRRYVSTDPGRQAAAVAVGLMRG